MEAYVLFAKDFFHQMGSPRTGIFLGWLNAAVFGFAFVFVGCSAVYGLFHPFVDNYYSYAITYYWKKWSHIFERDFNCFVYLWYCFFLFVAGIFFVIGVKKLNLRKMLPLLLLSLIGTMFSADFIDRTRDAVGDYNISNKIPFLLVSVHVCSFVCCFMHYLQLKYTPHKVGCVV